MYDARGDVADTNSVQTIVRLTAMPAIYGAEARIRRARDIMRAQMDAVRKLVPDRASTLKIPTREGWHLLERHSNT